MRILDLKGKVFFGLRQEMDSETLAKLSTQMFLCKPSRERLLQLKKWPRMGKGATIECFMIYSPWDTTTILFKAENL